MKHVKSFENHDTKAELVVQDMGETYKLNKTDLVGKMYRFFQENHEIELGGGVGDVSITYGYDLWGGSNTEDVQNAMKYLESLPGVESVTHRIGIKFELTFDKKVELL